MYRIAWFSPIGEEKLLRTSAFTHSVLEHVPLDWDLEIFVDDADYCALLERSCEPALDRFPVYVFHRAGIHHQHKPFDLFVYQLEDCPECAFVQNALGIWPGIGYFHDLNLNRLELSQLSHATTGDLLNDQMDELYGRRSPRLGDWHDRGWSIEIFDKHYTRGDAELQESGVIVVQNSRAIREVRAKGVDNPIAVTAFPMRVVRPSVVAEERNRLRQCLGLSVDDAVVGFAGQRRLEDRVELTLEAFVQLKRVVEEKPLASSEGKKNLYFLWMVADSDAEREASKTLASMCAEYPELDGSVEIVEAENEESFMSLLCVPDVMVSVKFDAMRGASLGLLGSLARGIPSVVSDFGPSSEIPAGVVLRVQVGRGEGEQIAAALEEILRNGDLRQSMAQASQEYVEIVCDPGGVFADFEAIIVKHGESLAGLVADREKVFVRKKEELVEAFRGEVLEKRIDAAEARTGSLELPHNYVHDAYEDVVQKAVDDFEWLGEHRK